MPIAAEKGAGVKTLAQPKIARVLFDESHSEAWTIRRELAEQMQPAHPEDSSYAIAAGKLADRDFDVIPNADRPLTRETLAGADVVVIAHPSDPKWEATTNSGRPTLRDDELDALDEFVRGGRTARHRPRRRPRRLRPLRRRLHRRARQRGPLAEPRLLGRPARIRRPADRHRLAGRRRPPLGPAQGGRRGAAGDAGAGRLG